MPERGERIEHNLREQSTRPEAPAGICGGTGKGLDAPTRIQALDQFALSAD